MFDKILVPLDGSELAEEAYVYALELAKECEAELVLVRVPVLAQVLAPAASSFDTYHLEVSFDQSTREANSYFETLQDRFDPTVVTQPLVVPGSPAEVICQTAVNEQVDLIVISSHGRTGWRKLVLGSIAEEVLRQASVPVLLIKNKDA